MKKKILLVLTLFLAGAGFCGHFPLAAAEKPADTDCVRGEPEPMFSKDQPGIQAHSFKKISSHEAEEDVVLSTGDHLIIKNGGCEYHVLEFRFESKNMPTQSALNLIWFKKTADVLRLLETLEPDTVFDFIPAAFSLEKALKKSEPLKLGETRPVPGDGEDFLQTQIQVQGGGKLKGKPGGYVEFKLFKGPL